jgi:methylamine---glutamate N-methyltransferase subunit A
MCGIVGYLDKSGNPDTALGDILYRMLTTLSCRGPDSAGVAMYGNSQQGDWILRIKLGEHGDFAEKGCAVADGLRKVLTVREHRVDAEYLRAVVVPVSDVLELVGKVERLGPGLELVSAGRRLEIAKQVGSPENLERCYRIRSFRGTHGIGHTRLSTESRIDLSHSQPFWARGLLDVATVHNGHITNYHKLRRQFEECGVRFYTENDSEIIGLYLRERTSEGYSFEEALRASVDDFDGSFCYLAANGESLAFVKDSFALKPLMVAETPEFVAMATEEIALRAALRDDFQTSEPGTRQVHVWSVPQYATEIMHVRNS